MSIKSTGSNGEMPIMQTNVSWQMGADDSSETSYSSADTTTNRYQARHGYGLLIKHLFPELSATKTHEGNAYSSLLASRIDDEEESQVADNSLVKSDNNKDMLSSALSLWKSSIILADNSVKNYFNLSACVQFITDKIESTGIYETPIVGPIVEGLSKLGEGFAQLIQEVVRTALVALAIIVPAALVVGVGSALTIVGGTLGCLYKLYELLSGAAVSAKDSAVVAANQGGYKYDRKDLTHDIMYASRGKLLTREQLLKEDLQINETLADTRPTLAKANNNPITSVGFELKLTKEERSAIMKKIGFNGIEFNREETEEFNYKAYNAERAAFAEAVKFAMRHGKNREEAGAIALGLMDEEENSKLSDLSAQEATTERNSRIPQFMVPEGMRKHPKTALEEAVLIDIRTKAEGKQIESASE